MRPADCRLISHHRCYSASAAATRLVQRRKLLSELTRRRAGLARGEGCLLDAWQHNRSRSAGLSNLLVQADQQDKTKLAL